LRYVPADRNKTEGWSINHKRYEERHVTKRANLGESLARFSVLYEDKFCLESENKNNKYSCLLSC